MLLHALWYSYGSCLDDGLVIVIHILRKSYIPWLLVGRVGGSD